MRYRDEVISTSKHVVLSCFGVGSLEVAVEKGWTHDTSTKSLAHTCIGEIEECNIVVVPSF